MSTPLGICVPTDVPRITTPSFLSSPACLLTDLWVLMAGADVRGDSTLIPHLAGRIPEASYVDETTMDLPGVICGDCNSSGVAISGANTGVGLEQNLNTLRTYVDPSGTGATWTLTTPSGATRSATVQVRRLRIGGVVEGVDWFGRLGMAAPFTLTVRLPGGLFV